MLHTTFMLTLKFWVLHPQAKQLFSRNFPFKIKAFFSNAKQKRKEHVVNYVNWLNVQRITNFDKFT